MKQYILALVISLCLFVSYGQVGIGTTTPDNSAILDITSTDSGVLVPRVALVDVGNTTTPVASPATGLLVWNNNGAVIGGNGVGFYFFNGAQWIPVQQNISADVDFYEEGTTSAPDDINDDIYTQGNVAIGNNTAFYPLHVYYSGSRGISVEKNSATGSAEGVFSSINGGSDNYGFRSQVSNSGASGNNYGIYSALDNFDGTDYGTYSEINGLSSSGTGYGAFNRFQGGISMAYGTYNDFDVTTSSTIYGFYNHFLSGNMSYGLYNDFEFSTSQDLHGVYNNFGASNSGSGNNFSVYSLFDGGGDGNNYLTYGINSDTGNGDHYGQYVELNGAGNGDKYGSYNEFNNSGVGSDFGVYNLFNGAGSDSQYGVNNVLSITTAANQQAGVRNRIDGSGGSLQYGVKNEVFGTGIATQYGVYNSLGTGSGDKYGSYNAINSSSGGTHYGVYSDAIKSGSYAGYFLGRVAIGTFAGTNYILPENRGTIGQIMQTDGAGNVTWQDNNDNADLALVRAHLNATYNQPATGANWVNINFASVDFDTSGNYDNGAYQFNVPVDGYYRINASYHTTAQANTNYYGIAIYISGTLEAESTYNHHGTGDVVRQVDTIAFLAAGAIVEVRIRAESNAVDIDGFSGKTFMEIQQINKN